MRANAAASVGFVHAWRRLNVAITRARRGLVLVGDPQTLAASAPWRDYLRWLRGQGVVVESVEALLPPTPPNA